MRPRSCLAAILTAVVGFGVTASSLRVVLPEPDRGAVSDKLAWFEVHRDDYDVLFFGSSRIDRGVIPARFDREMARRGHPVRSFNFGVPGMGAHETSALVRQVLERKPRRLRWVVVELEGWSAALPEPNRFKRRTVAWHDPAETASVLRTLAMTPDPAVESAGPAERLELAWSHLLHLGAWGTGAGRGRHWVEAARRAERRGRDAPDYADGGGFEPFSESAYGTPSTHPFRRRFLELVPVYRQAVARLTEADGPDGAAAPLERSTAEAFERQVVSIRRAGAEPVHVVTPTVRPMPGLGRLAEAVGGPSVLVFNDPERYPELFVVENRFDAEHLTTRGAELFTEHLADRFARMIEGADRGRPAGEIQLAQERRGR